MLHEFSGGSPLHSIPPFFFRIISVSHLHFLVHCLYDLPRSNASRRFTTLLIFSSRVNISMT
jgi:hypothetical protein